MASITLPIRRGTKAAYDALETKQPGMAGVKVLLGLPVPSFAEEYM